MKDYTILDELGKGTFGVVCKAKDSKEDYVAIKVQSVSHNRTVTKRELAVIDQVLQHENIVILSEHFMVQGRIYIVMEFCEGGDLNDYIIKNKPDLKDRFNLMTDMARGVLYLHSQNIVHRDLKPENVLLTNTGQRYICKITDFGISRIQEHKQEMFSTVCGTLAYIAPEIIDGVPYTNSVDVFSLGLIYFTVYKLTIIKDEDKKALIPAKIISKTKYELLNPILRRDNPKESEFIEQYFKRSYDMGKLVHSMTLQKPEMRIMMDEVLVKIAEERIKNECEEQIRLLIEERSSLRRRVREQENRVQEQELTIKDLLEQNEDLNLQLEEQQKEELHETSTAENQGTRQRHKTRRRKKSSNQTENSLSPRSLSVTPPSPAPYFDHYKNIQNPGNQRKNYESDKDEDSD